MFYIKCHFSSKFWHRQSMAHFVTFFKQNCFKCELWQCISHDLYVWCCSKHRICQKVDELQGRHSKVNSPAFTRNGHREGWHRVRYDAVLIYKRRAEIRKDADFDTLPRPGDAFSFRFGLWCNWLGNRPATMITAVYLVHLLVGDQLKLKHYPHYVTRTINQLI